MCSEEGGRSAFIHVGLHIFVPKLCRIIRSKRSQPSAVQPLNTRVCASKYVSPCYIFGDWSSFTLYRGADKSFARPGRKQATATRFWCSYILFIIIIGGILVLYIYIYIYVFKTRLASNEIFSPSNKIHREVGRAKDLSAPRYSYIKLKFLHHVEETPPWLQWPIT